MGRVNRKELKSYLHRCTHTLYKIVREGVKELIKAFLSNCCSVFFSVRKKSDRKGHEETPEQQEECSTAGLETDATTALVRSELEVSKAASVAICLIQYVAAAFQIQPSIHPSKKC